MVFFIMNGSQSRMIGLDLATKFILSQTSQMEHQTSSPSTVIRLRATKT
jgi:hypothetical protein